MVHPGVIEARLGELGFKVSRWFRPEIDELKHILMEDEKIVALACGRYFGSFALLVATDLRLLLIDKRAFFMTVDDTRYDMISEIDFNQQAYCANLTVYTISKTHKFTSIKHRRELRELTNYVQRRVWEFRQLQTVSESQQTQAAQPQPPLASMQASTFSAPAAPVPQVQSYQESAVHTAPAQPAMATQPNDYYVDDKPQPARDWRDQAEAWREHAAQAAHMVGSAATKAAHHSPNFHPRPFHPYISGSLMTHSPFNHSEQADY